jgi:hypothetical protein
MATTTATSHHDGGVSSGRGPVRGIAAILVILVGAALIGVTFANNLFHVGPAFEGLIGDFRPLLAQQSIDTARQDLTGLSAVHDEFETKVVPGLSQQLGLTPEQFAGMVTQQFPAVDTGMRAIPQAVPTFNGLLDTLQAQRPLFESADAIPTKSLSAATVPWGLLSAGILTILVGILIWFTRRTGSVVALVLGAALVVAPLVLSLPQKAADADQLNANLKPVYTQAFADQSKQTLATIGAMGDQLQTTMLPALATQLKLTPDQVQAYLGQNAPATAAALKGFPATMQRFQRLVATFGNNLDNYAVLKPVRFVPIIWTLIGGGIALVLLGGLTLLGTAREGRRL